MAHIPPDTRLELSVAKKAPCIEVHVNRHQNMSSKIRPIDQS